MLMAEVKKLFLKSIGYNQARDVARRAMIAGLLELAYIVVVAFFFAAAGAAFSAGPEAVIIGAVTFLILLVMSVAVSGVLVFGYPVYYLLRRQEEEAILAIKVTLGTMAVAFIFLFFLAVLF